MKNKELYDYWYAWAKLINLNTMLRQHEKTKRDNEQLAKEYEECRKAYEVYRNKVTKH